MRRWLLWLLFWLALPAAAQPTPLLTVTTLYENIYQIAYSPDGRTLATASFRYVEGDRLLSSIELWDARSGAALTTLRPVDDQQHLSFSYSPDGTRLVTGTTGGDVVLWDAGGWQPAQSVPAHEYPPEVRFAPNGQYIISADDGGIIAWSAADLVPTWILTAPGQERLLLRTLISPDSTRIAGLYAPGIVRFWDAATFAEAGTLDTGHNLEPYTVAYLPDGTGLALAYETLELWHIGDGTRIGVLDAGAPIYAAAFSPDGQWAALADEVGTITLWNMATRTQSAVLAEGLGFVWDMAFSPDTTHLAVAQNAGIVAVYSR